MTFSSNEIERHFNNEQLLPGVLQHLMKLMNTVKT